MPKPDITQKLSNQALAPLSEIVNKEPKGILEVTRRLSNRLKKRISTQHVKTWLSGNLKKRSQPRFGTGLVLIEIQQQMMEERQKGPIGL